MQSKQDKYDGAAKRAIAACLSSARMYKTLKDLKRAIGVRLDDTRFDLELLAKVEVKTYPIAYYGEVLEQLLALDPETVMDLNKGTTTTRLDAEAIEAIVWQEFRRPL